ncbi:MAG TPA: amidoligase family protein, partial [Balneolaceae bacterium]|nr:amidoligase family protein [Balneolaceae bacterium]
KKAEGTGTSFFHAFGLHLNPEVPDLKTETLLNTLRAFVLLQEWIRLDSEIDLSRRITPFIDDYSTAYKNLIITTSYDPDIEKFIDDYLRFNPSRNRPLDMLPVFEFIDNDRVKKVIDDGLTSARPAFHYRLPNCKIDEEDWSLAVEWNRWVLVELLANSKITLNSLCNEYQSMQKKELFGFKKKWIKRIHKWVYYVRQ